MKTIKSVITLGFLEGNRTYIAAYGLMIFAVLGLLLGKLDAQAALTILLNGMAMAGLRSAVSQPKP